MAETVEELTTKYHESNGITVTELGKEILTGDGWTTVIFSYQDADRKMYYFDSGEYTICRYKKLNSETISCSKFNVFI